jgi:hypothetical protein
MVCIFDGCIFRKYSFRKKRTQLVRSDLYFPAQWLQTAKDGAQSRLGSEHSALRKHLPCTDYPASTPCFRSPFLSTWGQFECVQRESSVRIDVRVLTCRLRIIGHTRRHASCLGLLVLWAAALAMQNLCAFCCISFSRSSALTGQPKSSCSLGISLFVACTTQPDALIISQHVCATPSTQSRSPDLTLSYEEGTHSITEQMRSTEGSRAKEVKKQANCGESSRWKDG